MVDRLHHEDSLRRLGTFDPAVFVTQARWTFAKTMPENPHEYTVRGETPTEDFEAMVTYVREHGYKEHFGEGRSAKRYTYLNLDGWRYWTMGWPVSQTTIINRARLA